MEYKQLEIEEKWRKKWEAERTYAVADDMSKPKYYVLDMFPYPSGAGLHVGHPLGYVASDIFARYKRMKGFNVLHPMGFDAFGLPAEQYAIETGTHPQVTTDTAISRYKEQLNRLGFNYDWSREVKTCSPDYYKWTQWIFIQLFNHYFDKRQQKARPIHELAALFALEGCTENTIYAQEEIKSFSAKEWNSFSEKQKNEVLMHYRLAYQSFTDVNWCEALGTVLANDEIKDGKSERGGHPVTKKKMRQWSLRITEYAERLLQGLDSLSWSDAMKEMQRNWIGKSEGALIKFAIANATNPTTNRCLEIFTTRPDTIFGVSFMVIAPEHEWVSELTTDAEKQAVSDYLTYVKSRSDIERQQEKKVSGCFTGSYCQHPFTGKSIPIFIAEYVLAGYGTGAIMGVPADDERDRRFAEKFDLPIIEIIDKSMYADAAIESAFGKMIHSDFLNGLEVKEAIQSVIQELEAKKIGKRKVNYRLRDAGYSRQRYWGEPFPVRYNEQGEIEIIENLPVVLPDVDSFKPTGDGRSPLANNPEWVKAGMETDTMPGYAGSSWYFLRYMDPGNTSALASDKALKYWQNVDLYIGGTEHAVGHLLYARFFQKFLFDCEIVHADEPFKRLVNQGMIGGRSSLVYEWTGKNHFISKGKIAAFPANELRQIHVDVKLVKNDRLDVEAFKEWKEAYAAAEFIIEDDGSFLCDFALEKMSKRYGNVVNPDDVCNEYGADCFRMFEMFLGPIEQHKPWDDKGIDGVSKFLKRFWRMFYEAESWKVNDQPATEAELKILHKTIKKVNDDMERLSFNTSVSAFMICVNELTEQKCSKREILEPLVRLLAPFAPFMAEELWHQLSYTDSIHHAVYPVHNEKYLTESSFNYPVSVNGKLRANILLPLDMNEEDAKSTILQHETILKWMEGKALKKFVFVKGKIANVVV